MHRPRVGIRGKILGFYGATLAVVLVIEIFAQSAAVRAGREFEKRLTTYHDIQGLRSALTDFRALGGRYMRESLPEQRETLEAGLSTLRDMSASLIRLEAESTEIFFEHRAVGRGMDAYVPLARDFLRGRAENDPDAYQHFLQADRIASYTDEYLGKLLSLSMTSGTIRYREIARRSAQYRQLAIAGLAGSGILAMAFAALFASSISAPVRRLAEVADRIASGDFDVDLVEAGTGDEMEVLAHGFNVMSANIRAMVEGLKEKVELERMLHEETLSRVSMNKALKEAQFMNLQERIRPHFLFNAINTIARSALFENAPETERLAQSLGKLMRYSLSSDGSFVTVAEELTALREYLSFQKIRFGSRLAWEIRGDPEVENVLIPRFSLQPIVENAVRHGIEPLVAGGRVIVDASRRGERVRLVVADSGSGMDAETLHALRKAAAGMPTAAYPVDGSREAASGVGMADLEIRLAYRYPGTAKLSISSLPDRGTIVRISLPILISGEYPDAV